MILHLLSMLAALWCLWPSLAWSDLFDDARDAISIQTYQSDTSGVSLRGGVHMQTGQHGNTTLVRGQATVGGPCGNFNLGASLKDAIEEIPDLMWEITQGVLYQLPMLIVCYEFPVVCDLVKHAQGIISGIIQHRYSQCTQIQTTMSYGAMRLRGGEQGRCLEEAANSGIGINAAMRQCAAGPSTVRGPSGSQVPQVNLFEDTLRVAGAPEEVISVTTGLVGEITIQAGTNGGLGIRSQRNPRALYARYEDNKTRADTALRTAVEEKQQTGTVSAATLRAVSTPGQPMPAVAIDALAAMRQDPVRYETYVGSLSTQAAIAELTWKCHDIENQLQAAMDGNQTISDAERAAMKDQLEAFRRVLKQVIEKTTVAEAKTAALTRLIEDYAAMQAVATDVMLRAPSSRQLTAPYRTQQPAGYSQ